MRGGSGGETKNNLKVIDRMWLDSIKTDHLHEACHNRMTAHLP